MWIIWMRMKRRIQFQNLFLFFHTAQLLGGFVWVADSPERLRLMSKRSWQRNAHSRCIIAGDICILTQLPLSKCVGFFFLLASKWWNIKCYMCDFTFKHNQNCLDQLPSTVVVTWLFLKWIFFFFILLMPSALVTLIASPWWKEKKKKLLSRSSFVALLILSWLIFFYFFLPRLIVMCYFVAGFSPFKMT